MGEDGFSNLKAHLKNGIQRSHRLLENHRNLRASNLPHLLFGLRKKIVTVKQNFAADDSPRSADETSNRHRRHGFPTAAFSDQTERCPFRNIEGNVVDGLDDSFFREKIGFEIFDFENAGQMVKASRYSPWTLRKTSEISPTVA